MIFDVRRRRTGGETPAETLARLRQASSGPVAPRVYPRSPISHGSPQQAYALLLGRRWPEELLVAVWPGPFGAFHEVGTTTLAVTIAALADAGLLTLHRERKGPTLLYSTLQREQVKEIARDTWFRDAVLWYASNDPGVGVPTFAGDWFRTANTARALGLIEQVGRWRKTWQPTKEVTEATQEAAIRAGAAWRRFAGAEPSLCRHLLSELRQDKRQAVDSSL